MKRYLTKRGQAVIYRTSMSGRRSPYPIHRAQPESRGGATLSHRSRVLTGLCMASEYGCYSPDDQYLAIAPLFHGAGFNFAHAAVFFGGTCEVLPNFDPEITIRKLHEK